MTTAQLTRKANGVSKGRQQQESRPEPPVQAPPRIFKAPPCQFCGKEHFEDGPSKGLKCTDVYGQEEVALSKVKKYLKCLRCGWTWTQIFNRPQMPPQS